MLPVSTALAWVVLVDRSTITGASKNAEENVENLWFERAAMGAFGDLMLVIGLGTGVVAIFNLTVAPALLSAGAVSATPSSSPPGASTTIGSCGKWRRILRQR